MTSPTSSVKSTFLTAFKTVFRRNAAGALVCIIISLLPTLLFSINSAGKETYTQLSYALGYYPVVIVYTVFIVLSVYNVFAVYMMFKPFYSRRACDYLLALPVKRGDYFCSSFLLGAAVNTVSFALNAGVYALVVGCFNRQSLLQKVLSGVDIASALKLGAIALLGMLALYAAFAMCAATASNTVQYFFMIAGCAYVFPALLNGADMMLSNIWGFPSIMPYFNDITWTGLFMRIYSDSEVPGAAPYIIAAVMIVALFLLGLAAFVKRRAEVAQNWKNGSFVNILISLLYAAFGMLLFVNKNSLLQTLPAGLALGALLAVICGLVLINHKRVFTKPYAVCLAVLAAAYAGFAAFAFNADDSRFVRYVPQAADVESVELVDSGSRYYISEDYNISLFSLLYYYDSGNGGNEYLFEDRQDIEKVIELHKLAVSDEVIDYRRPEYNEETDGSTVFSGQDVCFSLEYTMKNGSKLSRTYRIEKNIWAQYLDILRLPSAIAQTEPYNFDAQDIMLIEGVTYGEEELTETGEYTASTTAVYNIPVKNWPELREIMISDASKRSDLDFYSGFTNYGDITVYTISDLVSPEDCERIRNMSEEERRDLIMNGAALGGDYFGAMVYEGFTVTLCASDTATREYLVSGERQAESAEDGITADTKLLQ